MSSLGTVVVKALEEKNLSEVVDIHQSVLGYTFNSQMGKAHLSAMYRSMLEGTGCFVLVAFDGETPVGLVSGAIDMERTRLEILKKFTLVNWTNMLLHLIKKPLLIGNWMKDTILGKPVYYSNEYVSAILTTIAVKEDYQKMGVGQQLILYLENKFLLQEVKFYRLDTLITNVGGRAFYKKLGFQEIEQRSDSVVLIKRIVTP